MQFKKGEDVNGLNGKKIGDVTRVVIDPRTTEVTHLIIHTGFLGSDKVLPVKWVERTDANEIRLNQAAENLKDLPDFIETEYVSLNDEEMGNQGYEPGLAAPLYWYPVVGTPALTWGNGFWPAYPMAAGTPLPYQAREEVNIPEGTVPLKEGATVIGKNGKEIGQVEKVITEDTHEQVTHLVITKGLFNQSKKVVPAHWIKAIKEDGIQLSVSSDFVDQLKDYKNS